MLPYKFHLYVVEICDYDNDVLIQLNLCESNNNFVVFEKGLSIGPHPNMMNSISNTLQPPNPKYNSTTITKKQRNYYFIIFCCV